MSIALYCHVQASKTENEYKSWELDISLPYEFNLEWRVVHNRVKDKR